MPPGTPRARPTSAGGRCSGVWQRTRELRSVTFLDIQLISDLRGRGIPTEVVLHVQLRRMHVGANSVLHASGGQGGGGGGLTWSSQGGSTSGPRGNGFKGARSGPPTRLRAPYPLASLSTLPHADAAPSVQRGSGRGSYMGARTLVSGVRAVHAPQLRTFAPARPQRQFWTRSMSSRIRRWHRRANL